MTDQGVYDVIIMQNGQISYDDNDDELNEHLLIPPKRRTPTQTKFTICDREFIAATVNLCKAILGATIMALPRAIMEIGLIFGIIMFSLVGIFTYFSLHAILRGNHQTGKTSYSGVLKNLVGPFSAISLDVAQILDIIGILILYLMIIGDILVGKNQEGLLYDLSGINQYKWYFSKNFVLGIICVFFIFPWLMFDRLDKLAPVSVLGTFMIIIYTFLLVGVSVGAGVTTPPMSNMRNMPPLWPKIINDGQGMVEITSLVPVFVMALICHQNLLPILENLRSPSFTNSGLRKRSLIALISIIFCTTLFLVGAICAIIIFGNKINDDIMNNITVEELSPIIGKIWAMIITSIIRVCFVINMTGSFLVNALPLRKILMQYFTKKNQQPPKWLFYLLTFFILGSSYILAVSVNSIWQVVKLIGSVCANALAFIFPSLIMISLAKLNGKISIKNIFFPIFLIALGVVSGISGLYSSFVVVK